MKKDAKVTRGLPVILEVKHMRNTEVKITISVQERDLLLLHGKEGNNTDRIC